MEHVAISLSKVVPLAARLRLDVIMAAAALMALGGCGTTSAPSPLEYADAPYALTAEEDELTCKKLTGRMQIRLLEYRDFATRNQTSDLSRGLQNATTPIFGGTTEGAAPDAEYARASAQLEAYNKRLKEKGCKTFNLESEMQPKTFRDTPVPTQG